MQYPIRHREFVIRPYDHVADIKSVQRIYRECGWYRGAEEDVIVDFHAMGSTVVAALDDSVESFAHTVDGTMRYQDHDLDICAITTVLTSPLARRRGLGIATTANAMSQAADQGAEVANLGIFEQGYYDQLGFGSGGYENYMGFNPSDLCGHRVGSCRIPRRLTKDDWAAMDFAMKHRWISHGGCVLTPPEVVKCEAAWRATTSDGYGFGFEDEQGLLSHFCYGTLGGPHGPLDICAMAYQNREQLLELFALLRSLSDQISLVTLIEPPHLHLQDLLLHPFRLQRITKRSDHSTYQVARSFWQFRILDLAKCIAKTHLDGLDVEFNLVVNDPISEHFSAESLADDQQWTGIAGEYIVYLGEDSTIKPGTNAKLPTLVASINAFSRLWLGVLPASQLAISDQLSGPNELLADLDAAVRLPAAKWGWYF